MSGVHRAIAESRGSQAPRRMSRRRSSGRHAYEEPEADLNVVPVMGIMCILIPNMLYMFSFHEVAVKRVMAPRAGASSPAEGPAKGEAASERELNLTVMIRKDQGFQLSWDESRVTEDQTLPLIPMRRVDDAYCVQNESVLSAHEVGCARRGGACTCYDYPTLYTELVAAKQRFSTPSKVEDKLNLSADPTVKFDIVSRVMDVAECMRALDPNPSWEAWRQSRRVPGQLSVVPGAERPVRFCEPLLPKIVFALVD